MILDVHPGSGSNFSPSRIPGLKKYRIPDLDPQHCLCPVLQIRIRIRIINGDWIRIRIRSRVKSWIREPHQSQH
jgi:hypothetical protein